MYDAIRQAYSDVGLYDDECGKILDYALSNFSTLKKFLDNYDLILTEDFFEIYHDILKEYPPQDEWRETWSTCEFMEMVSEEQEIPLLYVSQDLWLLKK